MLKLESLEKYERKLIEYHSKLLKKSKELEKKEKFLNNWFYEINEREKQT